MNFPTRCATLVLASLLPLSVQAHKAWLLPSATVLSGNEAWITLDGAVSNDLFYFNHNPLRGEGLQIISPNGESLAPENLHTLKYRTVFDLHLTQAGTYRIASVNRGLFASWEENGEPKRWRGTPEAFAAAVPKRAEKLQVTQSAGRVETFVTLGAPDTRALAPTGAGLELVAESHPNDLFSGESARFRMLIDGDPAAGLDITLVAGGTRYRDMQAEIHATTAADGSFTVTWPTPGMYWMETSLQDANGVTPPATQRRASYVATFEVLPQ